MLFNFFKKKKQIKDDPIKKKHNVEPGSLVLSLDVGTEMIKCLIFEAGEKMGTIIGASKQRQTLGDMQGGAVININGVIQNCRQAIEKAQKQAGYLPEQVIIGIGGELVKGATTTINYEREDPTTPISLAELKNIVHKIQWKAFDQIRSQLAWETGYSEIDVRLVNAAIVDVRIDGYKVANPLGFQGTNISVSIFNAFAPLVHFGALQTIGDELGMDILAISAEPYAVSRCMGHEDVGEFSAIFIDIGGGTTDIAVVRNGGLEGTKMFALGGRTFTKRLSQILNCSFEEAEKVKLAYSNGSLDSRSHDLVEDAISNDSMVWLSGVELTLSEFYNVDQLPSQIYLCGGGSALPEIKKVLESSEWFNNLAFARQPKVNFLQPRDVTNIIDKTDSCNPQDVTAMALANLALDLAGEEAMVSKVLRKVIRMMQN